MAARLEDDPGRVVDRHRLPAADVHREPAGLHLATQKRQKVVDQVVGLVPKTKLDAMIAKHL